MPEITASIHDVIATIQAETSKRPHLSSIAYLEGPSQDGLLAFGP